MGLSLDDEMDFTDVFTEYFRSEYPNLIDDESANQLAHLQYELDNECGEFYALLPGDTRNTEKYNLILKNIFGIVDMLAEDCDDAEPAVSEQKAFGLWLYNNGYLLTSFLDSEMKDRMNLIR